MSALTDLFTSIANAIRDKSGETTEIAAAQFPTKISGLPAGAVTGTITASNTESMVIPGAIGKQHICVVNSTTSNGANYRVLAQISEANNYQSTYIWVQTGSPNIRTKNFITYLWDSATGTLTAGAEQDEKFNYTYTWIAW